MKNRLFVLLVSACMLAISPVTANTRSADATTEESASATPSNPRAERREAANWLKDHMQMRKRILTALKKIKNERTAERGLQAITAICRPDNAGSQTALGEVGEAPGMPETEAMQALLERNRTQIRRSDRAIQAELDRITELGLENDELFSMVREVIEQTSVQEEEEEDSEDSDI